MHPPKIAVFIVDNHPLMRQALRASILIEADMEVVGLAADGAEAVEAIPIAHPNIVIMDLMMPKMGGVAAIIRLARICPNAHILVLSRHNKEENIFKAVQAGARGYLTKDVQRDELMDAIRMVSAGKSYLPDKIMRKLMGGVRQSLAKERAPAAALDCLTEREKEAFALLGKGYSNIRISESMLIAESTVRVYLHQIMKKMGYAHRREAVVFAARLDLDG